MAYQRWEKAAYKPGQTEVYKLSRSRIELFKQCPRCFWLDERLKIKRPSTPPFLINSAVDELLKNEFDIYRAKDEQHPWQIEFKVDAKPFSHNKLNDWRHTFTGVQTVHNPTNLLLFGAVDDVWINDSGELMVVDYKATAKTKEIVDLDPLGGWHDSYRRQMEFYQWLLRQNGFKVSNTGYFVYANGIANNPRFDNKVEFRTNIFPYAGEDSWVEPTILEAKKCLEADIPSNDQACEYCNYVAQRLKLTFEALKSRNKQ